MTPGPPRTYSFTLNSSATRHDGWHCSCRVHVHGGADCGAAIFPGGELHHVPQDSARSLPSRAFRLDERRAHRARHARRARKRDPKHRREGRVYPSPERNQAAHHQSRKGIQNPRRKARKRRPAMPPKASARNTTPSRKKTRRNSCSSWAISLARQRQSTTRWPVTRC